MTGLLIKNNLLRVLEKIEKSAAKAGRNADDVLILAVSKKQPVEKIIELYNLGQTAFGENYVQEALEKQKIISKPEIEWHLIGALQTKKCKQIAGQFSLIHSVDSYSVLTELNKRNLNFPPQKMLLQINVAHEKTKSGFLPDDLIQIIDRLSEWPNLNLVGLSTMPPFTENADDNRPYFVKLKQLQQTFEPSIKCESHNLMHLSMGTSQDYGVAIEEGATIVRIGTELFGARVT